MSGVFSTSCSPRLTNDPAKGQLVSIDLKLPWSPFSEPGKPGGDFLHRRLRVPFCVGLDTPLAGSLREWSAFPKISFSIQAIGFWIYNTIPVNVLISEGFNNNRYYAKNC